MPTSPVPSASQKGSALPSPPSPSFPHLLFRMLAGTPRNSSVVLSFGKQQQNPGSQKRC